VHIISPWQNLPIQLKLDLHCKLINFIVSQTPVLCLEMLLTERVRSRTYLVSSISLNHKTFFFCRDTLSSARNVKGRDPLFCYKWAKVWNLPGWDELGLKTYDPNSIPSFCHPEPRPTTPIVLVDISSYSYLK
jgi:hypothetical protein